MTHTHNNTSSAGFTLLELVTVVSIVGILASVALPSYQDYVTRSQVSEGLMLLTTLKQKVEEAYNETGQFPEDFEALGYKKANGRAHGGPSYKFKRLFGYRSDMWDQIEYQPKGPHRVIVLRARKKPQWNNSDIGIHLQMKQKDDGGLVFRCTVNNAAHRQQYVPSTCRTGSVHDWSSWGDS